MERFDLADWYWFVDGDQSQVYSSAAAGFVPLNTPAYQVWLAKGNVPTRIRQADLTELLRPATIRRDPDAQDLLDRLSTATPAQVKAYVQANVTDLASAKLLLAKILLLLSVLSK